MKQLLSILGLSLLAVTTVQADEKYSHFPSLSAPSTAIALKNLTEYNKKLQAIVNKKELTPEDMVKVHELTYTLENGIQRLQKDLDVIATDLEKVHKASEVLDQTTIKTSGTKYLSATKLLTK